jgi:hypothetical protein
VQTAALLQVQLKLPPLSVTADALPEVQSEEFGALQDSARVPQAQAGRTIQLGLTFVPVHFNSQAHRGASGLPVPQSEQSFVH